MVRNAVSYHITIIDKKIINGITYLITDGTKYHIEPIIKTDTFKYKIIYSKKNKYIRNPIQVITGCTCKSSDIFITLKDHRELNIDDIVIFYDIGAYIINSISDFLIEKPNIYYL